MILKLIPILALAWSSAHGQALPAGTIIPERLTFSEGTVTSAVVLSEFTQRDFRDYEGQVLLVVYYSST